MKDYIKDVKMIAMVQRSELHLNIFDELTEYINGLFAVDIAYCNCSCSDSFCFKRF